MEWWISRWCEEFHVLPHQAIEAWQQSPAGLFERILEFRAYAQAKRNYEQVQRWESGPDKQRVMNDPLIRLVKVIEFGLVADGRRTHD